MRSSALILVVTVLACYVGPHQTPAESYEAAGRAIDAGDARAAVIQLRRAAAGGHIWALQDLAQGLQRGYLVSRGPMDQPGMTQSHLAIHGWPGEAALRLRQYESALQRGVAAGDADAALTVASRLLYPSSDGSRWQDPTPADRDSAAALLVTVADGGDERAMIQLASMAGIRTPDGRAWLDRAVAAGSTQACWWRSLAETKPRSHSTASLARRLDRGRDCAGMPDGALEWARVKEQTVGALRRQASAGNADAVAILDSLQTLGVFQRHPDLADA